MKTLKTEEGKKEERYWFLKYTIQFSGDESKVFRTRIKARTKEEANNKLQEFVKSKIVVSVKETEEGLSDEEIKETRNFLDNLLNVLSK